MAIPQTIEEARLELRRGFYFDGSKPFDEADPTTYVTPEQTIDSQLKVFEFQMARITQQVTSATQAAVIGGIVPGGADTVLVGGTVPLSGIQDIAGVPGQIGLKVLVVGRTNLTQNGLYIMGSGTWTRDPAYDSPDELIPGLMCYVQRGDGAARGYALTQAPTTGSQAQQWELVADFAEIFRSLVAQQAGGLPYRYAQVTKSLYMDQPGQRLSADGLEYQPYGDILIWFAGPGGAGVPQRAARDNAERATMNPCFWFSLDGGANVANVLGATLHWTGFVQGAGDEQTLVLTSGDEPLVLDYVTYLPGAVGDPPRPSRQIQIVQAALTAGVEFLVNHSCGFFCKAEFVDETTGDRYSTVQGSSLPTIPNTRTETSFRVLPSITATGFFELESTSVS